MFYLSAELGNLSSPGMTAPGPAEAGPPLHRASLASPPFFLPPGWATGPALLTSGCPPLSALHAFKTLQKELPVSDPGTWFWSGTRTFSATPRLRRQQQNRRLGPCVPFSPVGPVDPAWALPRPQTQARWLPSLPQPGVVCGVRPSPRRRAGRAQVGPHFCVTSSSTPQALGGNGVTLGVTGLS